MSDPSLSNDQFNAICRNARKAREAANPDVIEFVDDPALTAQVRAALAAKREKDRE